MLKFMENFSMTFAKIGHMEYPNLPERKLIDILANSRASRVDKAKKDTMVGDMTFA